MALFQLPRKLLSSLGRAKCSLRPQLHSLQSCWQTRGVSGEQGFFFHVVYKRTVFCHSMSTVHVAGWRHVTSSSSMRRYSDVFKKLRGFKYNSPITLCTVLDEWSVCCTCRWKFTEGVAANVLHALASRGFFVHSMVGLSWSVCTWRRSSPSHPSRWYLNSKATVWRAKYMDFSPFATLLSPLCICLLVCCTWHLRWPRHLQWGNKLSWRKWRFWAKISKIRNSDTLHNFRLWVWPKSCKLIISLSMTESSSILHLQLSTDVCHSSSLSKKRAWKRRLLLEEQWITLAFISWFL